MDDYHKIEVALRRAVELQKNFYGSAGWLSSIFGNLSLPKKEYDELINKIVDFLNNYSPK